MREDIMAVKEEFEKIKMQCEQESLAMSLLKDMKKSNKRMFIIWIITFVGLLLCVGYIIYLLNDIGTIQDTKTIDIDDVEAIDNSHIKIGDDTWQK